MRTIKVTADTTVEPDEVLRAAHDFSERRADVFPAVSMKRMEVHSNGGTTADVTEGTSVGLGSNWERCDYDWSQPGTVSAVVTDSNTYAVGGSRWDIHVRPKDGGGSEVEMIWTREFKRNPRGRIFAGLFRVMGPRLFNSYGKEVLENLEGLN